ncbi:MAG TPA: flagellin [Candidatus Latescibacteria bacterium]|nr:flagellin [Candidatus Handelsmanbacteria bacterium]HIL10041.1 flagellin [Candidatus Latescibacterota bacterium]
MNSRRQLNANNRDLSTRLERLSSGLRVNRASDDAAGLSIREGMRAEISGLKMNVLNAEQGSNLLQVAEGSLNEINAMLIRLRELSVQSASSTVNDQNREAIQAEYTQLTNEIDRIAQSTTYNDQVLLTGYGNNIDAASTTLTNSNTTGVTNLKISGALTGTYSFIDDATDGNITLGNGTVTQTIRIATLLDGNDVATGTSAVANFDRVGIQVTLAGFEVDNATGSYTDGDLNGETIIVNSGTGGSFQVGPNDGINNRIEVSIADMRASGALLNLNTASVATMTSARASITQIDQAIAKVSNQRGDLGAFQNRLAFTISFTENEIEAIQNSEASISDADIAAEVTAFTRAQILSQAATSMLAQANVVPQTALSLLQ